MPKNKLVNLTGENALLLNVFYELHFWNEKRLSDA